jgi:hypothetical protein
MNVKFLVFRNVKVFRFGCGCRRSHVLLSFSWVSWTFSWSTLLLRTKAMGDFETSEGIHSGTQRHIPEDGTLQ